MSRGIRTLCAGLWVIALVLPRLAGAVESRADSMAIPPEAPLSYSYDAFEQGVVRPLTRSLDLSLLARKLSGRHREAADLDTQDRVLLPSTWWQPRVGFKPVSVVDLLTGAGPGTGPATGPWTVVAAKAEGVSKGFTVQDSAGVRFAIKFDAPDCPELATSADVVASKLFWAAGYNVPDNTIAFFHREDLVIAPDATHKVAGKKLPLTPAFLDALLKDVPREADGSYRVVASRFLKGTSLGEWRYDGRRKGDQEDNIPHQLRRELRGLWAIDAWINHTDCSARNTLDMYVTDGGRSFVRHHLLDFSGCLGSASIAPQPIRSGHEYWVDGRTIATSLITLSLVPFEWEHSSAPEWVGLGFIDSQTFDPGAWRPYLANPAQDERTLRDIRWGARIVAAFTHEQIQAAVEQGRYSDARTTAYLVRVLEERRDKIVRRWLADEAASVARPSDAVADTLTSDRAPASDSLQVETAREGPAARSGITTRALRAAGNLLSDGGTVVASPFRLRGAGLLWVGAAFGVGTVLYVNDQEILEAMVRNRDAPFYRGILSVGDAVAPVGLMGRTNPYYVAALGAGYVFNVSLLRTIPTEILESHFIAGALRNVAKIVVGRAHPYEHEGPYSFEYGQGTSFPSGHASVAFELATIASMNAHCVPVSIVAYSLATSVAMQRVVSLNHWPSDVFIASISGTLVARTVVRLNERRRNSRAHPISLLPQFSDDGRLVGARVHGTF